MSDRRKLQPTDCTDDTDTKQKKNDVGDVVDERMPRRDALKAVIAAGVGLPVLDALAASRAEAQTAPGAQKPAPKGGPRGTPTDPDLLHPKANWPRKLSTHELATLAVLCDAIIPADEKSPAASTVGVPAYINEYLSAPYDGQMRDLVRVRGGLAWLETESLERFGKRFIRLTQGEREQICNDICYLPKTKPEFQAAARFFDLVRDLTATGFYSTDAGMKDLQYMGNMALPKFVGTPPEVLKRLGLT